MWWQGLVLVTTLVAATPAIAGPCDRGSGDAAEANAMSVETLGHAPFGRAERGWRLYAAMIAREIRTACPPETRGFAQALRAADPASRGRIDAGVFQRFKARWQGRRPFAALSRRGCPPPPPQSRLEKARPGETLGGKEIWLRAGALKAWRAMRAAARAASPEIRREPRALQIYSGFRAPDYDAARCERDGNCDGTRRARCSPHRTGMALDLWVGQAPGYGPDSTAEPSRRVMVQTPEYRWLVDNADRFGFVPYAFEPWHWEYVGEPIS